MDPTPATLAATPARPTLLSGRRLVALGVAALGAGLGAAYAHFIGCRTGTCPITSNVWVAALYGGTVGLVVGWPARERAHSPGERRP